MDQDSGTQKETIWEKLGYSLAFFVVMAAPALAVCNWLLGAPAWTLAVVASVLAVVACLIGFAEVNEEAVAENGDDAEFRWTFQRPVGRSQWLKRIWELYWGWAVLCLIVNKVVLEWIFHASVTALAISTLILLLLAVALEFFDYEEIGGSAGETRAEHADEAASLLDA